jgi:tetratricopeptide (TPR) repeat protein
MLKGEHSMALADFERAHDISKAVGDRTNLVAALLGKSRLFCEIGYWAGCDSIIAELDSYTDRGLSYDHRWESRLHKARLLHARNQLPEALELARDIVDDAKRAESEVEAMLLLGKIGLDQGDAPAGPSEAAAKVDALGTLVGALEEAHAGSYRGLEAEGLRLLARALSSKGRFEDAAGSAEDALDLAGRLGMDEYEYLVTCGDILTEAGRGGEGLPFYVRALDAAATVFSEKCPTGLRGPYLERKRIRDYLGVVEELNLQSDERVDLPDYNTIFHLD